MNNKEWEGLDAIVNKKSKMKPRDYVITICLCSFVIGLLWINTEPINYTKVSPAVIISYFHNNELQWSLVTTQDYRFTLTSNDYVRVLLEYDKQKITERIENKPWKDMLTF